MIKNFLGWQSSWENEFPLCYFRNRIIQVAGNELENVPKKKKKISSRKKVSTSKEAINHIHHLRFEVKIWKKKKINSGFLILQQEPQKHIWNFFKISVHSKGGKKWESKSSTGQGWISVDFRLGGFCGRRREEKFCLFFVKNPSKCCLLMVDERIPWNSCNATNLIEIPRKLLLI